MVFILSEVPAFLVLARAWASFVSFLLVPAIYKGQHADSAQGPAGPAWGPWSRSFFSLLLHPEIRRWVIALLTQHLALFLLKLVITQDALASRDPRATVHARQDSRWPCLHAYVAEGKGRPGKLKDQPELAEAEDLKAADRDQ